MLNCGSYHIIKKELLNKDSLKHYLKLYIKFHKSFDPLSY